MSSSPRLLVVTESFGIGGTENHLIRLLPRLVDSGWTVATFCLTERGKSAHMLEAAGVDVFSSPQISSRKGSSWRYPVHVALASGMLFRLAQRWRPDIAHFYLPGPYVIGAPVAMAARVPIKIMSRRSLANYQQNWPTVAQFERVLHRRMDMLIGNSRAVVAELIAEGVPESKVKLIYNGIDVSGSGPDRGAARRELGLDADALVGVVVANLIHYKGHRELIRGLAHVAERLPSAWRILLAGRDHGLQEELERQAKEHGIAENIHFLGERSDVPRLLAAADFGMLTSREEGFSNVILESMAAGLPMIVTAVGGNPEAILDERTGLIVPPKNPEAIGEAVLRLACDPDLRMRLGTAGRNRVVQEFSIDRCFQTHNDLYEELLTKVQARSTYIRSRTSPSLALPRYAHGAKRPLMLAYWGRYGALPQLTLEIGGACGRVGHASRTTISISTTNELFDGYGRLGELIFPVQTYVSPFAALDMAALLRLRRNLMEKLVADGTRAFVTLMPHIWSPLITPMLRQAGIRHTVIIHDADPHLGDRTALLNRWLLREAKTADQVVTLTSAIAERLVQSDIVPEKKISVLFHPDLTYGPKMAAGEISRGPLRVLFFGRMLPYKGLSGFTGAMEILKRAGVSINVGVFGAGEMGPDHERLENLGAEVVNEWINPIKIANILERYDVVVVSHTKASQSGVIAAAHGAGLPVIATPVGGLPAQIIPEVTGLIAADTSAEAIAAAVRRFAEDRNLLLRIRQGIMDTRKDRSMERFFLALREVALNRL
jgi:glycosyltransferase involved in cell wall biosynthesis